MTHTIAEAVAAIARKVPSFRAGVAKFVVPGVGSIVIDSNGPREGDDPADVTLTASAEVFRGILAGKINPATAFMSGKLEIDGPLSLAMKLGSELG
jgi:putative sterol carrier protein